MANAVGRTVLGAAMVVAPGPVARLWMGSRGSLESKMLGRTHGIRDVAVGAGLVWALENGESTHAWVTGAAISDAVDAAVTLAYWGDLPRRGRVMVLALAASSAVQMGVLAARTAR